VNDHVLLSYRKVTNDHWLFKSLPYP